MLEQLRQNSRSFIIWILFGIIIAVFVVSFGPQSGPDTLSGCGTSTEFVVKVDNSEVSSHSWWFAMNGLGFGSGGGNNPRALQRRHVAIDYLVERELLAQAAERAGFRISDEQVNDSIASGDFYVMGRRLDGRQAYFKDGVFDYDLVERFANSLGLASVPTFIEEQRREILADSMRDLLLASARVSLEEARNNYIHNNTTITAEYVKFDTSVYARAMKLSESDLEKYAASNSDSMNKAWESEKPQYSVAKDRVRSRHIFVRKGFKPTAAAKDDDDAKDDDTEDTSRSRIDAAVKRLTGGDDFAVVALEVSDDNRTKYRGGSLGWRSAGSLGYGKELVAAAKDLEVGKLSEVVETTTGYHVIEIQERSTEGLTFDQRKLDIAARLAPNVYADARAKADAEAALVKAQETPLDELFVREIATAFDLPGNLPPETRRQLEEMLKNVKPDPIDTPTPGDTPAPAGDTPAPADTPVPGSESGWLFEVEDIPVQIGSNESEEKKPTDAAADPPISPSDLPQPVDLKPPALKSVGPVARPSNFSLAGVGRSEEIVKALFDELDTGKLGPKIYKVSQPDGYVLIRLADRENADLDVFEGRKDDELQQLKHAKGLNALVVWTQEQCSAVASAGLVSVNISYLTVDDAAPPPPYKPCQFLTIDGAYEQVLSRIRR